MRSVSLHTDEEERTPAVALVGVFTIVHIFSNSCTVSCAIYSLTLAGAQEILPAGPQQAGESRHAGRDLSLQQWTNSGADLQQVVCTDVSV